MRRAILRELRKIATLVLLAGFACALLVRYAPGSQVDERELDPRLRASTVQALRDSRAAETNLGAAMVAYLRNAAHGDLGYSNSNGEPITDLLKQSAPVTLKEIAIALGCAWIVGLGLGAAAARFKRNPWVDVSTTAGSAILLSVPAALVAFLSASVGAGSTIVLALVLAPRIFRFSRNLLVDAYRAPHVEIARSRGVPEWNVLRSHVLAPVAQQLWALAASSVSMAIGASIPVEAICGTAGLGRLAWQAASSRDLLLLVNLTMVIALATSVAAGVADAFAERDGARA